MAERRRGLGRGLGALIPSGEPSSAENSAAGSEKLGGQSSTDTRTRERGAAEGRAPDPQGKEAGSGKGVTADPSKASKRVAGKTASTTSDSKTDTGDKANKAEKSEKAASRQSTSMPREPSGAAASGTKNAEGTAENREATGVPVRKRAVSSTTRKASAAPNSVGSSSTSGERPTSDKGHDVSRETPPGTVASKGVREPAKPARKRRDMVQALRSTTSVSRPVDMFFLSSGNQGEHSAGEAESEEVSKSFDVSRETSPKTPEPRPTSNAGSESAGGSGGKGDVTASAETNGDQPVNDESRAHGTDVPLQTTSTPDSIDALAVPGNDKPTRSTAGGRRVESVKAAPTASPEPGAVPDHVGSETPDRTAPGTEDARASNNELQMVPGARFAEVPVADIHPNRRQPRQVFDEDELAELAFSVKELGVLQPIVVRPSREEGEGRYELVMGERRWRAVQEAGLDVIPAIIRDTADNDLLRDALLENLHRAQLNPLEEAAAYQQLMEEFGATQEQLSDRIGRSRPQISNTLRLLRLPALVQRRVAAGVLSSGHARALLALSDPAEMERLAQRIVAEGLSVRATEEAVALADGLKRRATKRKAPANRHDDRLGYIADAFSDKLDTSVKIQLGARKGKMTIEFASVEDLNRIIDVLDPKLDAEN